MKSIDGTRAHEQTRMLWWRYLNRSYLFQTFLCIYYSIDIMRILEGLILKIVPKRAQNEKRWHLLKLVPYEVSWNALKWWSWIVILNKKRFDWSRALPRADVFKCVKESACNRSLDRFESMERFVLFRPFLETFYTLNVNDLCGRMVIWMTRNERTNENAFVLFRFYLKYLSTDGSLKFFIVKIRSNFSWV